MNWAQSHTQNDWNDLWMLCVCVCSCAPCTLHNSYCARVSASVFVQRNRFQPSINSYIHYLLCMVYMGRGICYSKAFYPTASWWDWEIRTLYPLSRLSYLLKCTIFPYAISFAWRVCSVCTVHFVHPPKSRRSHGNYIFDSCMDCNNHRHIFSDVTANVLFDVTAPRPSS